jgi:hypothetical protein
MNKLLCLLPLLTACAGSNQPPQVPCQCAREMVYCVDAYAKRPASQLQVCPQEWISMCRDNLNSCQATMEQ